jgi:protein-tyrosine-phosphatase
VTRVAKLGSVRPRDLGDALARGGVIAPVLGGYCVLSADPDVLERRLGNAHRLLENIDGVDDSAARRLLRKGCVCVPERGGRGVALAEQWPAGASTWLGVPEEAQELGALLDDLGAWVVLAIQGESDGGPGPTVVSLAPRPSVIDRRGKLAILDVERELGEFVRLGPGIIFSVLVVCTGNSCRSPVAQGLLARLLSDLPVLVGSAGTGAPVGNPATRFALESAAELGVDIGSHRARQLTRELCLGADLILAMEKAHQEWVREQVPDALGRVRMLGSYPDDRGAEIADPVGRSLELYRETAGQMKSALERVAADIRLRFARR